MGNLENRRIKDRKKRSRLRKLGYTQAQAVEIVKVRSKLAARGIDLTQRLRQQCVTGKIVYASDRIAKSVSRDLNLGHDRYTQHLQPYACPYCKMWHLTSKPTRKKKL